MKLMDYVVGDVLVEVKKENPTSRDERYAAYAELIKNSKGGDKNAKS